MTDRSRARSLVVPAFAMAFIAFAAVASACGETRRSLGEDCIRSEDCLSNLCASAKCSSDPPLLDGSPPPDTEAGADVTTDADAGSDAASEASDAGEGG
jgi:hypothetical protein